MFGGSYVHEHFQGHRQALARPPRHSDLPSISTNTVDEFWIFKNIFDDVIDSSCSEIMFASNCL